MARAQDDVIVESGFRKQQESYASMQLRADMPHLLIPMTYKKGVAMEFKLQLYSSQPMQIEKARALSRSILRAQERV